MRKFLLVSVGSLLLLSSCKKALENKASESEGHATSGPITQFRFQGNYVSDGYVMRNEGYDWVGVSVRESGGDSADLKVRSRADKKKPACTLDATLNKVNDSTYQTFIDGKEVVVALTGKTLHISTKYPEDEGVLAFYCSGGSDIAGKYFKIEGALDQTQIDKTSFSKVLRLQGVGFNITAIEDNGENILTVQPFGLEEVNRAETFEINGAVTNAETEDLNSDGSPELIIFISSYDSENSGDLIAFSVNNGKSMSQVYFPPTRQNPEINKGYRGFDEFAIVETSLVQRFPLFEATGDTIIKTDKIRQVTYTLEEGEAMRRFEVDTVSEY